MKSVIVRLLAVLAVVAVGTFGPVALRTAAQDRDEGRDQRVEQPQHHPSPAAQVGWPTPAVEKLLWRARQFVRCVFWTMVLVHILVAIWVFTDIRKRGEGHGIFIVLALLTGICGGILYALVRLGDRKT